MPSEKCHLAVADRNQKAIDFLLPAIADHSEWITTIAFYKAVHLVEAVFTHDPVIRHGINHENREAALKGNKRYAQIWRFYRLLWSASTVARYLQDRDNDYSSFSEYLSTDDVKTKVLSHWLVQIEASVKKFLAVKPLK
jgi:hypothetical protein